jgi:hypothetical protein
MDELLKQAMGSILETSQIDDTQKLELIKAIHTLYKYLDILELEIWWIKYFGWFYIRYTLLVLVYYLEYSLIG